MTCWLADSAGRQPEAAALIQDGESLCYAELAAQASRRAATLSEQGLGLADRVMLEAPISIDSAIWFHALMWLGATIIPVAPGLRPTDVATLRRRLQPKALIGSIPALGSPDGQPAPALAEMILVDAARPADDAIEPVAPAAHDPARPATIVLTSGSTSTPKAVPLTLANHAASAAAVVERLGNAHGDRWLLCLPLEHVGGLAILFRSVIEGHAVALMRRFDPAEFIDQLNDHSITLTSLVPSMLESLVERGDRRPPASLRAAFIGGAPAAPGLLNRARDAGWPVLPTWGMTEAGSQLATPSPATAAAIEFSNDASVPLPPLHGVEVRTAPSGALQVRGAMLFSGYLGDTASGPDPDGWFTTSDKGVVDANGMIRLQGRLDNVIISGGVNVHLDAVAQRLAECPLIADAAVVGVDDQHWGQRVAAAVVVRGPETELPDALGSWSRENLQPAERPAHWKLVDRIPRSTSGKPLTPVIRALFE